MKCIKAIKSSKSIEAGTVTRVDDNEAEMKVSTGYWQYVPKSEWKAQNGKNQKTEKTTTE
jgi:hypothetical protein